MTSRTVPAILSLLLLTGLARGQEKADTPRKASTPLKLQITLARYLGEKKVSSAPYLLAFCADDRPARLRMGTRIPVRGGKEGGEVSYQEVGNNIDCSAGALGEGRFRLQCTLDQSFVYSPAGQRPAEQETSPGPVPLFRTFRSEVTLFVRDGQSVQYTSAADPVSGETLRVEGTLSVVR
jgi:hypothetical protein